MGQNFSTAELDRCKRTLALCLAEGVAVLMAAIALILPFGKLLLSIFNSDPQVVEVDYIRLVMLMTAHIFSLCYSARRGS